MWEANGKEFFSYDFIHDERIGKITQYDIASTNKLIVLCNAWKFDVNLLTHYKKPNYYGTTRSGHLGYFAYEIDGIWLIVYRRKNNLPKGIEADDKSVEMWQECAKSVLESKSKRLNDTLRATLITVYLNKFIESEIGLYKEHVSNQDT